MVVVNCKILKNVQVQYVFVDNTFETKKANPLHNYELILQFRRNKYSLPIQKYKFQIGRRFHCMITSYFINFDEKRSQFPF